MSIDTLAAPSTVKTIDRILNLDAFRAAPLLTDPYPHTLARGMLLPGTADVLRRDFPVFRQAGYHPVEGFEPQGAFATLLREIEGPEMKAAMTEKFGIDFGPLPSLVTVRYVSAAHEGCIHTDSRSKVATLLLYLNRGWSSPEGRLRVLRDNKGFDNYTLEVPPDEGTMFAFLRGDRSWHGHTPFVGERRVVQIAWLRDAAEIERKRKRHRVSRFLKRIFGG
ncbi:2OG-Fe(II) oxygenase [Roseomonas sp. NAR14]|uniref:2OG-Fe(II) oxygenase n=1 Tax=Roseomonas acroporae TaxID=2937791 RepID=A0A9X2BUL4_9PROT|nr:2OG-Fe(II) oxygenase [Roseomonas acroporae]MCK8784226.1 2OG-Fe(II) oxygenase [Roseomonas acroporae]